MTETLQDLFRRMRGHFPALRPENDGGYSHFDNAAGAQLPQVAMPRRAPFSPARSGP